MITKAEASVFWSGITSDINNIRNTCQACNRMTPSQSSAPPTPMVPVHMCRLLSSQRQELSGDCRSLYKLANSRKEFWWRTRAYLHIAESLALRYSRGISFRWWPRVYSKLNTEILKEFLGCTSSTLLCCISPQQLPCRGSCETVKRMLTENSGPRGELDTDKFQRVILQHRNCPDRDQTLSRTMPLWTPHLIPILPGCYHPHST